MHLTDAQFVALEGLARRHDCPRRTVPPGTVLQTRSASREILLIRAGYCRVLDPGRQFGSLTVLRVEGPYLCGALGLLDSRLVEEVTASTSCELTLLGLAPLPDDLAAAVQDLLDQAISPSELPLLHQLVTAGSLPVPADQQTPAIYLRRWRPATTADLALPAAGLIYADRPDRGFQHGQPISATTLQQFWSGASLPRLLIWSELDAEPLLPGRPPIPASTGATPPATPAPATAEELGPVPGERPAPLRQAGSQELAQRVRRLGYAPVRGLSPNKRQEAVLTMVSKRFSLPTRRDTLRKAASFLVSSKGGPTLDKLIFVIDQLGLIARVVSCRTADAGRLPTPAIALDADQQPRLIVEASAQGLLVLDPAVGIVRLPAEALLAAAGTNLRVVVVSTGSNTPKARFGLGWMLPYLSHYRLGLLEVFIASFITQLFALATPMLFQQIIDRVIGQGASSALGGFAALMVLFMVLELVFSSLRTFQFMEISNRIDITIGSSIISRLLRLNARYFEKRPVGELSSRLNELDKIRSFLTGTALTVVLDALFALLYFGVMFFYSPLLSGIILGSIPLLLIVIMGLTPVTQRLIRQRAEAHSRTQSYMVEVLNGIQTVKLQNSELTARRNWEDRHLDDINKAFRTVLANTASSNALQLINKTTNILVICVGSWLVLENKLTLGGLIAFRIISSYVTQPILRLASTWDNFQEVSMAVERLGDVVNQPLETSDLEETNIAMAPIHGKISFDQVGFSYSSAAKPQLAGVSLEIPAGSFTGLVGQSGCGKSTLLKLIPRLYEPSRGKVLVDDLDVSKVELYSLRRQLGFVPQDCLLFEGSIYSNIAVADPETEAADVIEAARMACAHDFIMGLPYGYSTPLGEKGSGLSGGQRQRIALARMLLQNPALIILDEATSALDVDTEQQVVSNLRRHAKGRTILIITHRLSTLIDADQIVMMHEGRVDSVGTHEELMAKAGRYYALYKQQLGG
ncbi:MAG: peptidase domain-containing ABC transporter [Cyanobacteriota bacterium]|nr:peptidase domain-containing ABC transporter [Cyanobacteriota bacterium]